MNTSTSNDFCPECHMPGRGVHWAGCSKLAPPLSMSVDAVQQCKEWYSLVSRIALKLNCLPSMFPGENGHIERKLDELIKRASSTEG